MLYLAHIISRIIHNDLCTGQDQYIVPSSFIVIENLTERTNITSAIKAAMVINMAIPATVIKTFSIGNPNNFFFFYFNIIIISQIYQIIF
ncbi:MAG: hypothetical protein CR989_02165 [Flavobacteriales bacterium]|nr:MAG: hypothetical protein CR989_02165 [Flavobacteriales bacterium]